jgi:hypothetical protein
VYLTGALGVSGQGFNIKTIKLSPSLAILWTANWNGAANLDDAGRSIVVDTAGNVFVAGYTTASDRDGILLKYTSSGSLLYATSNAATGAGEFTGLALSSAQEPFVGGYTSERGNKDFLAQLYTNSGTLQWSDTYNGYANEDDVVQHVTSLSSGNFLLSGTSGTSTLAVKYNRHALLLPLEEEVNAPFIENRGQVMNTDTTPQDDVRYYTRSNYPNTYIFDDQVSFVFAHIDTVASSQDTMTRLDLRFINETSTVAVGLERQEDFHNYYLGHIPEGRERVPLENKVLHPNIYTNIDALYGQGQDGFFARFVCKPGSTPGQIRLLFRGHTGLSIQTDGSLRVETALEDLILAPPTAIFSDASGTESAAGWAPAFVLSTDSTVRFSVGTVPSGSSLIIKTGRERYDPENECDYYWSTYFGEVLGETVTATDVDIQGNMFVTGKTKSQNFPKTPGAFQEQLAGIVDAYAGCFKQLDQQRWLTFFGGVAQNDPTRDEIGLAIKWHALNKSIYFVGSTGAWANDFPLAPEGLPNEYNDNQTSIFNFQRGFIVKLSDDAGDLKWSTYFGDFSFQREAVTALNILSNGNVIVGGVLDGPYDDSVFPTMASGNQHQQNHGLAYIAEFGLNNNLLWATRLTNEASWPIKNSVSDITEGLDNEIYITGVIGANTVDDFVPIGNGSLNYGGKTDAYIMRFTSERAILWSSFLGGSNDDIPNSILFVEGNKVVVTGTTYSNNFPVIACDAGDNDLLNDISFNGGTCDIFMSKFVENGMICNYKWGRFFGGPGNDRQEYFDISGGGNNFRYLSTGNGSTNEGDNIWITGLAYDEFSPLLGSNDCDYYYPDVNQGFSAVGGDAIIMAIDKNQQVLFSTFWGGSTNQGLLVDRIDIGSSISVGINPNSKPFVFIGGQTNSRNYTENGVLFEANIPVCHESQTPYFHEDFLGGNTDGFVSKIYLSECLTTEQLGCPVSTKPETIIPSNNIILLPNPVSDLLTIRLNDNFGEISLLRILDLTGKDVGLSTLHYSDIGTEFTIPVKNLPKGVYQIVVFGLNGKVAGNNFIKL